MNKMIAIMLILILLLVIHEIHGDIEKQKKECINTICICSYGNATCLPMKSMYWIKCHILTIGMNIDQKKCILEV